MEKAEQEQPPNAAGRARFTLLREWARQLNADWDSVLKSAGVVDKGRTTKNRIVQGTASIGTARDIGRVLDRLETKKGQRTDVGREALLLDEWAELGARLALASPSDFNDLLDRLRKIVEGVEARSGGPFTRAGT